MRELLLRLNTVLDRQLPCLYCSVVATRGSTPQKAGAAMLVFPDGSQFGTLGGGCVEAEVKQKALQILNTNCGTEILSFHLNDDYGWDDGLICGGRMTILVHPIRGGDSETRHYYRQLLALTESGTGFSEALIIADAGGQAIGDRYLFDSIGQPATCLASQPAWHLIAAALGALESRPKPTIKQGIAYLPTPAHITLLLVGGGHVGQAVAKLAAEVDFRIWVLDDRASYTSLERFPSADRRIAGDIGTTLRDLLPELGHATYALIVTRGHNHDEEALYHLAGSDCGYVGMIGSRRKIKLIFDDLLVKGITQGALDRVRAPIGLDIGSQTVPEIAISIVAELIARRNLAPSAASATATVT